MREISRLLYPKAEDVAVYRQAWENYLYGDRDPQVKVMARAYERWLELQAKTARVP
jgi:hypothetical protein